MNESIIINNEKRYFNSNIVYKKLLGFNPSIVESWKINVKYFESRCLVLDLASGKCIYIFLNYDDFYEIYIENNKNENDIIITGVLGTELRSTINLYLCKLN